MKTRSLTIFCPQQWNIRLLNRRWQLLVIRQQARPKRSEHQLDWKLLSRCSSTKAIPSASTPTTAPTSPASRRNIFQTLECRIGMLYSTFLLIGIIMRTPAGKECDFYYEDFHRGRELQECRIQKAAQS